MSFASHPCFSPPVDGIVTRGSACRRLSDAIMVVPEAYPARLALGDPFSPERRLKALNLLNALAPKQREKILAADRQKRSRSA
jgi:hypothetical protein